MSVENCVSLASELTPQEVLNYFVDLPGEELQIKRDASSIIYVVKPDTFQLTALDVEAEDQTVMFDWIGILPTVELIFTLNKWKDLEAIHNDVLAATLRVTEKFSWDFAFLLSCDEPVLVRKSGNVILQDGHEFWNTSRLAIVPKPYVFKNLEYQPNE